MSFVFDCPKCKEKIQAEKEMVGKQGNCPKCKERITVPQPSTENVAESKKSED
jgi:DNA-directed RNA polymerase subunit RPC12/RpoP